MMKKIIGMFLLLGLLGGGNTVLAQEKAPECGKNSGKSLITGKCLPARECKKGYGLSLVTGDCTKVGYLLSASRKAHFKKIKEKKIAGYDYSIPAKYRGCSQVVFQQNTLKEIGEPPLPQDDMAFYYKVFCLDRVADK